MSNAQNFESAGFSIMPTRREIGMRQALHIYPESDPTQWGERNSALVLRRSTSGLLAQFVGQLHDGNARRGALKEQGDLEKEFGQMQQQLRAKERSHQHAPAENVLAMLTEFQQRMFRFLWEHEGIPLSHEILNTWCSRSKDEERKQNGGGAVLHTARRNLRKKLRGLGIGELFTVQKSGVLFLSPERSGLPAEALMALRGAYGIHGLNYDVLRQYAPSTTPYGAFAQALADVGYGSRDKINPQRISRTITKLNKIDTGTTHFVVQAEQKRGYRLFSWNEIPESWVVLLKKMKLQVREGDLLVHFLSRDGEVITLEEVIAILGEPGSHKLNNAVCTSMSRFINRVQAAVHIDTLRAENQSGRPIVGYRPTALDSELIVRSQPLHELYLRLVRRNQMMQDKGMENKFASFDPAVYDKWGTIPQEIITPDTVTSESSNAGVAKDELPVLSIPSPPDDINDISVDDGVLPEDEQQAWEAAAQTSTQEAPSTQPSSEEGEDAYITSLQKQGITASDPTDTQPGSWQKAAILRWRIATGTIPLWHPQDRKVTNDQPGNSNEE